MNLRAIAVSCNYSAFSLSFSGIDECSWDEFSYALAVGVTAPFYLTMALFLCSEKAGLITGENICIDGGMTKLMIYHGEHGWKYQA